jgi:hypothetical protein
VDSLVGPALASIVAADPGAVIIVFSDHGPQQILSWSDPDDAGTKARRANRFAARTPGHSSLFPDDVTLVNVLPVLFNVYFGTDLPLQPDDTYFGPGLDGSMHRIETEP